MSIYKFDKSEEIIQARLDLFKPLSVDTSVFKSEYVTYRPVSQITKGSPTGIANNIHNPADVIHV